jgi:nitrous oxidase accessory protein NosD
VLDIDFGQYKLNGDLVCRRGTTSPFRLAALTITGEGVHFNLAGYTITRDDGTGRQLRQGIAVRGANAHINGGSIVDINCPVFGDPNCAAIELFEAPGALINGMSLHNNTVGIFVFGNADGARIHGNDITGNLRIGIGFFGSAEGAMITGNDLSDTGGFSAPFSFGSAGYLGDSSGVSLIGNVANNSRNGILIVGEEGFPAPQRNTIRDNTTLDNRNGIQLLGFTEAARPRDNLIQSNTSFGNESRDLSETIGGVGAAPDCLNTWMDNDFDVAEPDCIE